MEKWFYTAAEVAVMLGWDAQYIRNSAQGRYDFKPLPFPTIIHGRRVQIPKAPFDEWFQAQKG